MNELSSLRPPKGATRARKRLGRGIGSGTGKTSGKGHKGSLARKSPDVGAYFEGGQMPIQRRLPKVGFRNKFATSWAVLNVRDLSRFEAGSVVDEEALRAAGLVKGRYDGIKLLGEGELDRALTVRVHKLSKSAAAKVTAAGGTVDELGLKATTTEVAGG
jgi:large subunit ribosomal protein L15